MNPSHCQLTRVASRTSELLLAVVVSGNPALAVVLVADALEGAVEAAAVLAAGQGHALVARQPLPPHRARAHVRPHAVAVRSAALK